MVEWILLGAFLAFSTAIVISETRFERKLREPRHRSRQLRRVPHDLVRDTRLHLVGDNEADLGDLYAEDRISLEELEERLERLMGPSR
jgi:hypothetical protein